MSPTSLTGPKRILARWRQRREPVLQLDQVMTDDDDVDFASDLHHFHDLLETIHTRSIYDHAPITAFPTIMSTTLDIALVLVRDDFPDPIAAELAAWRAETAAVTA